MRCACRSQVSSSCVVRRGACWLLCGVRLGLACTVGDVIARMLGAALWSSASLLSLPVVMVVLLANSGGLRLRGSVTKARCFAARSARG
ncbi:hypothetical protein EDB83DRAFT_2404846 [Lactarius deliciosus]|nr:hypothetical protein EDB83DRAFT_2404846 [Lactarius deliciosus]